MKIGCYILTCMPTTFVKTSINYGYVIEKLMDKIETNRVQCKFQNFLIFNNNSYGKWIDHICWQLNDFEFPISKFLIKWMSHLAIYLLNYWWIPKLTCFIKLPKFE